jgi:Cu(I)/Ag(I) efflux system membrane fusion protein
VVLRRGVSVGTAVDPSTPLLTAADLSTVWVLAEVPESSAAGILPGMSAWLDVAGSGLAPFEATIEFVYPTLSERTRTLRIRFAIPNPEGVLRPGMYGTALIRGSSRDALTVPRDAVVDTGRNQHLFVAMADGRFAPRTVTLGLHLGERIEILDGLADNESIVVAGVFLLDSESRLRSGASAGHAGHGMPGDKKDVDPHEEH